MKGFDTTVSKRQGIVSSPLEADHWNKNHLPELYCFSMWNTTKSPTSVGQAVTKTLLVVPDNHYGPLSAIILSHVPCSCIAAASRLDRVQMQVCLFECRARCKCADECINNEGGGLPVSHYFVFVKTSYSHKDAMLSIVVISEVFKQKFLNYSDYV